MYSSILEMPDTAMFCVISTALVLQGVIISRRGPMNVPLTVSASRRLALPNSHVSFAVSSRVSSPSALTAIIFPEEVLKKITIPEFIECL
ncbi:MAG: hypothetical protein BWY89_01095 [Bacteroidetes bacterium ADurb.BinA012]|nr:MAG: hypothetical protein BWY89_01095 [Bacteroidetes bacterium ADurb.BinA012]